MDWLSRIASPLKSKKDKRGIQEILDPPTTFTTPKQKSNTRVSSNEKGPRSTISKAAKKATAWWKEAISSIRRSPPKKRLRRTGDGDGSTQNYLPPSPLGSSGKGAHPMDVSRVLITTFDTDGTDLPSQSTPSPILGMRSSSSGSDDERESGSSSINNYAGGNLFARMDTSMDPSDAASSLKRSECGDRADKGGFCCFYGQDDAAYHSPGASRYPDLVTENITGATPTSTAFSPYNSTRIIDYGSDDTEEGFISPVAYPRRLDLTSKGEPSGDSPAAAINLTSHSNRLDSTNIPHRLNPIPEEFATDGGSTAEAAPSNKSPLMLPKSKGQLSRVNWKDEDTVEPPKTETERRAARRAMEAFKKGVAELVDRSLPRLKRTLGTWMKSDQQVAATVAELAEKVVLDVTNPDIGEKVMQNVAAFIRARSTSLYRGDQHVGGTRTKRDQDMVETVLIAAVWENEKKSIDSSALAAALGVSPQLVDKAKIMARDKVAFEVIQ